MITEIPFSEVFVYGVSSIAMGYCVTGVTGFVGDVELVCHTGEEIVVSSFYDHGSVEVFLRD